MGAAERLAALRARLEAQPPTHEQRIAALVRGWGWGVPMRATLHDGSVREGYLTFRSNGAAAFMLSDSLDIIACANVEKIEAI